MSTEEPETFRYPVEGRVLRSTHEYSERFLPAMHEFRKLNPRMQRCVEMVTNAATPEGVKLLDYGCGAGTFPYHVAARRPGWTVEGWDADYSSLEIARTCFSLPNVRHERHPFDAYGHMPPAAYDIISLLEVVEHLPNSGEVLNGLRGALRPDGLILVSTPNILGYNALTGEFRRFVNELIRRRRRSEWIEQLNAEVYDPTTEAGHILIHSVRTLGTLLRSCGFQVVDFDAVPLSRSWRYRFFPETIVMVARRAA